MKPPILVVAFGSAAPAARRIYALLDADIRAEFPGHGLRWAWTARSLVARLRARGEDVQTLDEALDALRQEAHGRAAVLSLHLVPGEKHREILSATAEGLRLSVGQALLEAPEDVEGVASELLEELPADRPVLVVAHGHASEDRFNAELRALGEALSRRRSDVYLTRLEGDEDPQGLQAFIAQARAAAKVHVAPFLLVAGDHVASDILGEGPESLRSRLDVPDFECGPALGERAFVRRRFLRRLEAAVENA